MRDKIVQSTKEQGGEVNFKTLKGRQLLNALVEKLSEEVKELKGSDLSVNELADIQELLDQIVKKLKITKKQLESAQTAKSRKNGGFEKGYFIESLTLPNDNKWTDYYAADPKRFPEIRQVK